jgi:hypothetical protein
MGVQEQLPPEAGPSPDVYWTAIHLCYGRCYGLNAKTSQITVNSATHRNSLTRYYFCNLDRQPDFGACSFNSLGKRC